MTELNEFRGLKYGDELYLLDGVGRRNPANVVTFVSGPHRNGTLRSARWIVLARCSDDTLKMYNTSDLRIKPVLPEAGQTWQKTTGRTENRYVDSVVANRYVILKSYSSRPDNAAHLMTMENFLGRYKKVS